MIKKQSVARARVKTSQHRIVQPQDREDNHEAIAKIAYAFWERRGYRDGDPVEDWLRAEAEHRRRLT